MSYRTGLVMLLCRLLRFLATLMQRRVWRHTLCCIRTTDLFCMPLGYHWQLWLSCVTASSFRGNPSFTSRCQPCYDSMHSSPRHRILLTRPQDLQRDHISHRLFYSGRRAVIVLNCLTGQLLRAAVIISCYIFFSFSNNAQELFNYLWRLLKTSSSSS